MAGITSIVPPDPINQYTYINYFNYYILRNILVFQDYLSDVLLLILLYILLFFVLNK